jgi:CspA family cold shock protein
MSTTEINVMKGTCSWFSDAKGYGFIRREDGGPDAYVHFSAIVKWNRQSSGDRRKLLREGDRVEFELVPGIGGKAAAKNVRVCQ